MSKRRLFMAAGALAAFCAAASPTDNISSEVRNDPAFGPGVMLGPGAGFNTSYGLFQTAPHAESTLGAPIISLPTDTYVGQELTPPDDWDGTAPTIYNNGGAAVWIDFAKKVIATQPGYLTIAWQKNDSTVEYQYPVISAAPAKRPVRLYWTHERPASITNAVFKPLQNAGPTVQFGSNYKVHIYGTEQVRLWRDDGDYDGDGTPDYDPDDEWRGYVRLNGQELQALEGTRGSFLIVYSRLDEAINRRVMLAYEVVTVLEPTQTQIDIGIGDQLKPQSRPFSTSELFPMVTRGLTDDADNGEIYVYQHASGEQKNYLWAIRDSSANPWKIEVYWRAKEELDVVWPFEVDIYGASWKDENAQVFLRNGEGMSGDAVAAEPKVLVPGSMTVEAMDYQVVNGRLQKHVQVEAGSFYTTLAATNTYALLKYTAGESVWFQTVKSVKNDPSKTTAKEEILGMEILPPEDFAGGGFVYPGWIRRDFRTTDLRHYPVANAYNPDTYAYPTEWATTNNLISQIFPVNLGELEVWWSKVCDLNTSVREGSGSIGTLSTPIYFPTAAYRHQIKPRLLADHSEGMYNTWNNGAPQIVIASGRGSAGLGLNDSDPVCAESSALRINIDDSRLQRPYVDELKGVFLSNLPGKGTNDAFTVENWLSFNVNSDTTPFYRSNPSDGIPWVSFHAYNFDTMTVSDEARLALRVDLNANLWVNGVKKTGFSEIPTSLFHKGKYSDETPVRAFHVALVNTGFGTFRYYVNGIQAAEFAAGADEVIVGGDEMRLFPPSEDWTDAGKTFHGDWYLFRVWKEARDPKQIYLNRYTQFDPVSTLLVQYGAQTFYKDRGTLDSFTLVDSSGNRADGRLGFETGEYYETEWDEEPRTANEDADWWIVRATQSGIIPAAPGRTFPASATIYRQNDPSQDGYNPNEEHAFMKGGVAYALRCDLNKTGDRSLDAEFTSLPYVLVQYPDADRPGYVKMEALRVVPENDIYRFKSFLDAGFMIQSISPLETLQPANLHKFISGPLYADTAECFKDRKGWYWAHQAGNDGGTTNYVFEFSYPSQEMFDYTDGTTKAPGTIVGFMEDYEGRSDDYLRLFAGLFSFAEFEQRDTENDPTGTPIDYTFIVKWPDDTKGLYVNDTLIDAKNGLPAIDGQLSVKVVYEQSMVNSGKPSVRLIDGTRIRTASMRELPDDIKSYRYKKTGKTKFTQLPPFFHDRLVWNPGAYYNVTDEFDEEDEEEEKVDTRELELTGKIIREISYTYLWPNVLDARAKANFTNPELLPGGDGAEWQTAVRALPGEMYELKTDDEPFDTIALTTTGKGAGYVTLVMNNSTNEEMVAKNEVVSMYVIKVVPELAKTYLHPIYSDNPLDQQINMKATSDFGGEPGNWEFQWKYCDPQNGTYASITNSPGSWFDFGESSEDPPLDWITIGDAGVFGLSDHYITYRYRAKEGTDAYALVGSGWSDWCKPALAEGWIKRVLKAVNPFEQRIRDYYNTAISTDLSMLQQAGSPYQGDVPLNLEALNENGLLAIYETVLNHARKLTIDADKDTTDTLSLALQMAAGRIAELYMVLGNEALADAMNPTVDLGNDSPVDDGAESSIFPFMNQCENLLDEELALLRGRDLSYEYTRSWTENTEPWAYPYYNRLQWNFTHDIMGGHVAYTLNYGIKDVAGAATAENPSKPDGSIDVYDAVKLYPQGHGDAYGHFLSAEKGYYSLLRHPNFGWKPQIESILAGTVDITMSYFHEKRFALAAQAKARTAAMIVAGTYRQDYVAGERDPWLCAEDDGYVKTTVSPGTVVCTNRAWGVGEWAARGHLGAYYDWLTVNALLPTRQPEDPTPIKMLDRESTYELASVAASARRIQSAADYADQGLNPLGLADNAIPFDISPSEIDAGKTHYEQIYDRAVKALGTAHAIFKRAKKNSNALRDQNENSEFDKMVAGEEAAIDRRLKEIYGYPYDDDIGVGKLYPQGYDGPDLEHYYYIESYALDGQAAEFGRYYDVTVDNYSLITTNVTGKYTSKSTKLEIDYGNGSGNWGYVAKGAIELYQDYMPQAVNLANDYWYEDLSSYTNTLALPVTIIDTGTNTMDGVVEYKFAVAAWTNNPTTVSYYMGAYGFTPKPSSYKGQRRAEGEIQIALQNYAAHFSSIKEESEKVKQATTKIKGLIEELAALDQKTQMGYVTTAADEEIKAYNEAVKKNAEEINKVLDKVKEVKALIADVSVEALPKITGMSFDFMSAARAAFLAIKQAAIEGIREQFMAQEKVVVKAQEETKKLEDALTKQFNAWQKNEDRLKKQNAIKEQVAEVKAALAHLEVAYNNAGAARMAYAKLEAEGDELQSERERLRIQWAADLSQKRYRNMMYQILRDDELQRYNEAFELAAKYTFLAAKAYDYETGLLQSDSSVASGSQFLSEIIRTKALGRFSESGEPLGGGSLGDPGLADILYRMNANWSVLKTRLGFNNAQGDIDSFSLRKDLFGKSLAADGDTAWMNALASCWCEDLRAHPVFAAHCQPFDPMDAKEPGFAIPFQTVVAARKDLFGNDLMGGSTAYSSTYFATKLRGVGVWFETAGAAGASIPTRPEIYLVPSGNDYMRVPIRSSSSAVAAIRTWQVVDQVLPVPYSLTDSDWDATDWSALKDICANELFTTRRHPAIRAQTGSSFDESAMVYNARLIGRSVWNDQWYIFIPAASLNADNERARAAFINAVKDIHLNLKTYSLSGN